MENWWEAMETVTDFIFLVLKITTDSDNSHKIKRRFIPGKKSYDKPSEKWKSLSHVRLFATLWDYTVHGIL